MPSTIRPGDVLAGRYRLVDLLTESGGGRFWRAHDRVLERHVALHVIAEDDERAELLLDAARRSATVHDRRLLRVLDADRADGFCYVVNEWGSGDSLDIMLAGEGPLGPRRAAWLVSEVAAAVAVGHELGVTHGRLVPENVLVDQAGAVRLIGFAVDAAMHGLPPARPSADVADIGGLLYSALTGRWPGQGSAVPPAPVEQGRVLRPRQVRAGIPRPLDTLCDELVNPYAGPAGARLRETHDIDTARGVADYLTVFVGDATGLAAAEAAAGHRDTTEVASLPPLPDPPVRAPGPPPPPTPEPDAPTAVGLDPVHEDPDRTGAMSQDEVEAAFSSPAETAAPPPPFEDPPERPLFAPAPAGGAPLRTPRTPPPPPPIVPAPEPPAPGSGRGGFWPWDTGTGALPLALDPGDDQEVPGRSWLRLAAVIAGAVLLLLAVVVAYNLGRGRTPLGSVPDDSSPSPSASASPVTPHADPIPGVVGSDYDPQGSPPDENPDEVPLALDHDPTTAWQTLTYKQNFGPGGLKTGVGLILDLGGNRSVSAVDVRTLGGPTGVSLYLTDQIPASVDGTAPVAKASVDGLQRIELDQPTTGRYLVVWLTSIPATSGGFRGEVAEVTPRG